MTSTLPEEGQIVTVRDRRWVVTDVVGSAVDANKGDQPQHLVALASVEDDGLGEELRAVWQLEPGARVLSRSTLPEPTGLDEPEHLDALLNAVRWASVSTADHKNVQSPFRSGIEIDDYQLDPVVRAIDMPRANLLIADDVGLGKTIEAGLIMLELLERHRANRMLVVCPAGLQIKWKEEMRDRFGLEFRIVDSQLMRTLRRTRGIHANPWTHFPRLITSIDYLKRDRPRQLFRETLPPRGESAYPRRYDLLVLDEAQNCAPSGRGKYAIDSQRTEVIRELAPHFEHKLFLSATPHNGYSESFSALLELLDDQRFARGTTPDEKQLRRVMIRRLKDDITDESGSPRFPKRQLNALEVDYTEEERAAHDLLTRYGKLRLAACESDREQFACTFVLKTLKKRLFSSPAAFAKTLETHIRTLAKGSAPSERSLIAQLQQAEEDFAYDDEFDAANDDALSTAGSALRDISSDEKELIKRMQRWAASATASGDSKVQLLIDWLRSQVLTNGKWNRERVLIFTEYRDTQNWLVEKLAAAGLADSGRLKLIYGGMNGDERERIKAHFQHDPDETDVRILVATDCASEGVDLQRHCAKLVHMEIPWNPNRLEQRNGRIDRRGQKRTPEIYHFVSSGYADRMRTGTKAAASSLEGDLEFLARAAEKVETIRQDLGKVGTVIADQVEQAMLGKRSALDTSEAEEGASRARRQLKFERDVKERIERLRAGLAETRSSLALTPQAIEQAVQTALALGRLPDLVEATLPGAPEGSVFKIPELPGSWSRCSEGLKDPVSHRRRPITFDHEVAEGRTDVVLAHLNHRLVQMSLRLLRAEIWQTDQKKRLHRITTRSISPDLAQQPVFIAHGRLMVIGSTHQRLHEELITAGGHIVNGRWERLPQGAMDELLSASVGMRRTNDSEKDLLVQVDGVRERLMTALEARMRERAGSIQRDLDKRLDRDLGDIRSIMEELAASIASGLELPANEQLFLEGLEPEEEQQLERNRSALQRRLQEIPVELEQELGSIRARFADPTPQMFPLAITILVPEEVEHA